MIYDLKKILDIGEENGFAVPAFNVYNLETVMGVMQAAEETGAPAVAIEMPDGTIITGKTSSLLGASSACLLNALKYLGGIPKDVTLISPEIIEPIQHLKVEHLGNHNPRLHTDETLMALSITSATSDSASRALAGLGQLRGCDAFFSVIISSTDEEVLRRLGINVCCEPKFERNSLFHK